jgi:ADP-dependent NAD(P)H-hydrate dehydratase / NAD(P)H-hydrate epimerase
MTRHPPSQPAAVWPSRRAWPLHDAAATRAVEQAALALTEPHQLMRRAGLAVARLALAVAPHAQRIRVLAGPGNNGGDGLVAAVHLHQSGCEVRVSHLADPARLPDDARDALALAQAAGVPIDAGLPDDSPVHLVIDALLGVGANQAPRGAVAEAIAWATRQAAPVLAVDLPSGLDGNTGTRTGGLAICAAHTLALLTLKPGLFTAHGRDQAGQMWFDDLQVPAAAWQAAAPSATLAGPEGLCRMLQPRHHAQHKGSFGDLLVIGGAPGMTGAAGLAAQAALAAGAGRVYVGLLDAAQASEADDVRPELMHRPVAQLMLPATLAAGTVVCGCGGGSAVAGVLPQVLQHAARLVLDADALNAVAADAVLRHALRERGTLGLPTVLTPHPLEAARLAGCDATAIQADRMAAAADLAEALACTVLLKGSGSVVATPGSRPSINPTGNARLGTAGTGDVLAGWLGGLWSGHGSATPADLAAAAAWLHGRAAEEGAIEMPLLAHDLISAMQRSAARLTRSI